MNEKELKENIEKIKQFLTLPDYDKIDAGIELAVSLEEPKIFETLLDGCSLGGSRPKLNEWMQEIIISDGELINQPTTKYITLNKHRVYLVKMKYDEKLPTKFRNKYLYPINRFIFGAKSWNKALITISAIFAPDPISSNETIDLNFIFK